MSSPRSAGGSGPARPLEVMPVPGLPEVSAGDDLAALIAAAADLRDGDVVVVAQKVVSKAEGAFAALGPDEDVTAARRRLAVEQARRVVVDAPSVVVVETRHGFVCANGGIDASNVPDGALLLLPADPDASARRLREDLRRRTGVTVAVLVSDTFGRPWRTGQTDVAIGAAGIAPLRDERGRRDRQGRVLDVTEAAVADELAGAADLVRGKADGVPVVLVRGLRYEVDEHAGAAALVRPAAADLFRRGRGALADALAAPTSAPRGAPVPERDVERALRAARRVGGSGVRLTVLAGEAETRIAVAARAPGDEVAAGAAAGALLAALLDLEHRAALRAPTTGEPGAVVVTAAGGEPATGPAR